jgi:polyene macrolide polyketide synthase
VRTDLKPFAMSENTPATPATPLARRLAGALPEEHRRIVLDLVLELTLAVFPEPPAVPVDARQPFRAQGLDSLRLVELHARLSAATGLALPVAVAFDYPTPEQLAGHLLAELSGETAHPDASAPARVGTDEPIAVVGIGCRLPGGIHTPEQLWDLLQRGASVLGPFPDDRGWDLDTLFGDERGEPGKSYVRQGAFLADAAEFDNDFFGIGPREALAMDPQQRLLLEIAWEAVERAGVDPHALRGSRTGVFVGAAAHEYGGRVHESADELSGYLLTGSALSVASGRIAYALGLNGPAVSLDTACSGSLVALHLACRALAGGECDFALAGGVTVLGSPALFTEFSRQQGLAPDGRVKAFAAAADGTGFAEGAGILALERLPDALRAGHPVLAVIRGSATNSDGASNGLTAPSGPAQRLVIGQALADAGLTAADVDVLEAHGTGTTLGDPVEAGAILATYGAAHTPDRPLWLGSVKSNLGHTQAAGGVTSLIKLVLAMRHGLLPATLNVDEPTPHVDWSEGTVRLATEPVPWPADGTGRPRRAAVSAFGVSGTNAHVVIEAPPAQAEPAEPAGPAEADRASWAGPEPVVLSGSTEEALRAQAARLLSVVDGQRTVDIALSAATTRAALEHRAVVIAADPAELAHGLRAVASGTAASTVVTGTAGRDGLAFLFSGQGSQRIGMGARLAEVSPVFAAAFDEAIGHLDLHLDRPLREVLAGEPALLDETGYIQPALFALEVALFRQAEAWGLRPDYLAGHSVGELAAVHVAGVLSLADAAALVGTRARLMAELPGGGAMVAIRAGEADVRPYLSDEVGLAAVNGPEAVVLSGVEAAVLEVAARFAALGHDTKRLRVSHAFHSPLMDPMLPEFRRVARILRYSPPRIPLVSAVTGRVATAEELCSPEHWIRHVSATVRFADVVRELTGRGVGTFVEIGPDAVLSALVPDGAAAVPLLRRGRDEARELVTALARLHAGGKEVGWREYFDGRGSAAALPTYAFQRRRFWLPVPRLANGPDRVGQAPVDHPMLGALTGGAGDAQDVVLTGRISTRTHPWLADHVISGTVLVPGTAVLELALQAGAHTGCPVVAELTLEAPLVLSGEEPVALQVVAAAASTDGRRSLAIHSSRDGARTWVRHASGVLATGPVVAHSERTQQTPWPPADAEPVELSGWYERMAGQGYGYGPAFRGLRAVWRRSAPGGTEVFAEVTAPAELGDEPRGFGLHPAVLDAVLHAGGLTGAEADGGTLVPFAWTGVSLHATGATTVRAQLVATGPGRISLALADPSGAPLATVDSLVLREVSGRQLETARSRADGGSLHHVRWAELATPTPGPSPAVFECPRPAATELPAAIRETTAAVLAAIQDRLAAPDLEPLVVLTRHALSVDGAAVDLTQAPVPGLIRAAQAEHPGRLVLLDVPAGPVEPAVLAAAAGAGEPELALREGVFRVPRLARDAGPAPEPRVWQPDGTVLITGGTGGLGQALARHLVTAHGVRRLVLLSRRGNSAPGVPDLLAELSELSELDAEVTVAACDAGDREALASVLAAIPAEHPLSAVVHTAGVLDDGVVAGLSPQRLDAVLAAKADAAWHLHELTRDLPLTAFVLYSSVASRFDNAGQGGYAAANAFLDGLAATRASAGLPATSIAWGLWTGDGGMGDRLDDVALARVRRSGLEPSSTAENLALFDLAVAGARPAVLPVRIDAAVMRARPDGVPALLRELVPTVAAPATPAPEAGRVPGLAGRPPGERRAILLDLVRTHAAAVLGYDGPAGIKADRAFQEAGFDSLAVVELRNRINVATGLNLPPALLFDHPSPRALAGFLDGELGSGPAEPAIPAARRGNDGDPIAIVGMACRYPGGVRSAEDLWRLVADGVDAVGPFPVDRGWPADLYDPEPGAVGRSYAAEGGFLLDAAAFDADFFGIGPREAQAMDPQQRLMLEIAWEALEHAGVDPLGLRGSTTGVFSGVMYHDWGLRRTALPEELAGHHGNGSLASVVSGRVAYTLGLEGPALTVDTACSSSLVALHLAANALRGGECTLALAGGVTVMSTPDTFVDMSRQRGLAADGRCKSFGAGADGTGWGEGVGVLVLERLSDARRNGHRVLALVRGSAVNSDGASNGLTAPNGLAQQRVIRNALADARLGPADVDAVEGHGTGTTLGDPIEARALLATYGRDRAEDRPLLLGSVKSNLAHTQAASGIAGVIKMVQAMRHGVLPQTLHAGEPSPQVDWSAGAVRLLREKTAWPDTGGPRRAGVSSFGISGTNAHVVLEHVPDAVLDKTVPPNPIVPVLLSGRSPAALRATAARLRSAVLAGGSLVDIARTLSGRAALEHRAAFVAGEHGELLDRLGELAEGTGPLPEAGDGKLAVLFTGQGAQRLGMGRTLYETFPVYARAFDDVAAYLPGIADVVFGDDPAALDRTEHAQPALFAVEVALYRLIRSWGIEPAALAGHSVGELAAAHVAGVWSLADAAAVVAARGRLMQALPASGVMIAVQASEDEITALLDDDVDLAAVNGPESVVLSGPEQPVLEAADAFGFLGRRTRRLATSHAFHSRLMEPMLDGFRNVLAEVSYAPPSIPVVSTLTGRPAGEDELCTPEYWVRQVRGTVRFGDAVRSLAGDGVTRFLELGPDAVLSAAGAETAPDAVFAPALRRERDEVRTALEAACALHVAGEPVDWSPLVTGGALLDLPAYPFQHQDYWLPDPVASADVGGAGLTPTGHPLLAAAVGVAGSGELLFTGRLSRSSQPWLADHRVQDAVVFPGTALLDLAVRAGDEAGCDLVERLDLHIPLVLPESGDVVVQVLAGAADETGRRELTVHASTDGATWILYASGVLATGAAEPGAAFASWPPPGAELVAIGDRYDEMAASGLGYGPAFRGLHAVWRSGDELFAEARLPESEHAGTDSTDGFGVHPALLDAVLHAAGGAGEPATLPFSWENVSVHATGARHLMARITPAGPGRLAVVAADPAGTPVFTAGAVVLREYAGQAAPEVFTVDWRRRVAVPGEREPDLTVWTHNPGGGDVVRDTHAAVTAALGAVQEFLAGGGEGTLVVRTSGAVATATDADVRDLAGAAVHGLVRSAQTEHPGRIVLVDTETGTDADLVAAAVTLGEPQVAIRGGELFVPRLASSESLVPPADTGWRLGFSARGAIANLRIDGRPSVPELARGEVRIAVRATGVNFRDVLNVLGNYPGDPGPLGYEATGVVLETGAGVTGLRLGDRVMGLVDGGFATECTVDHRMLVPVPPDWTDEQAASVPLVFLTAYYALHDLAGLKPGESVLIHAAAGGVGMAATQLAQRLGATVFGTASPGKHDVLREAGIEHVASSRSTEFEDRFSEATGGTGVDVVLNALTGDFVDESLRLLPRGGRFVEMGKLDVRDPEAVAAEHPGVRYRAFDVTDAGPDRIRRMWTELAVMFERGELRPLPVRGGDVRQAKAAFRFLSQGRNVGKLALRIPRPLDPAGTVLITGGTGGLGALMARHLVRHHGVRQLLLLSRRGAAAPGAEPLVTELEESGATVTLAAVDVAERDDLAKVLAAIPAEHPLTGVVHTAGLLDDGLIGALGPHRLAPVLRPKVDGAWHLHELTANSDLRMFVLFSSAAGVLGGGGQGSYAAANAFLDGLARHRVAAGLPGQSLAWGLWEYGMGAALSEADVRRNAREGFPPLTAAEGPALFDAAIAAGDTLTVPVRLDRQALRNATGPVPALLRDVVRDTVRDSTVATRRSVAGAAGDPAPSFTERLAARPAAERLEAVLDLVRHNAAVVLGHARADAVSATDLFKELGFDSLGALELRNRLSTDTGLRLPSTMVFDHPTATALSRFLLEELAGSLPSTVDVEGAESILAELDRLAASLARTGPDDRIARRLRELAELSEPEAPVLGTATADEVIDFLDKELGIS